MQTLALWLQAWDALNAAVNAIYLVGYLVGGVVGFFLVLKIVGWIRGHPVEFAAFLARFL